MTQIFVFTAGHQEARDHLEDSIERPVDPETVFDTFPDSHREALESIREQGNGFYAWGAIPGPNNKKYWDLMAPGDFVLGVYEATYHYASRVLDKHDNKEFAEAVWGTDNGDTWQLMYFLTEPIKVSKALSEFGEYLYPKRYGGFTRISDKRLDNIVSSYGSVDRFIAEMLDHKSGDLPPQLQLGRDRVQQVAEESLEVDRVTHGDVDEDMIPEPEGRRRIELHVRYERSPQNRRLAIRTHGTVCKGCDFDFDEVYGRDLAGSYVEIHHIKPLSEYEGEVNPATDLVPLCANCHRMVHRRKETVMPVKQLRELLKSRGFLD